MPDKKLTDSEIVKALECCNEPVGNNACQKCPLYHSEERCSKKMLDLSLDLINRLQAELAKERNKNSKLRNERNHLQADLDSLIENDLPKCKHALRRANEIGIELQAENERLKKGWKADVILTANVKAEAYKEFAEKIDKEFSGVGTCNYGCVHHKTRKVLKKLVGDDNSEQVDK